jgi:hypothetical protein
MVLDKNSTKIAITSRITYTIASLQNATTGIREGK